MWQVIHGDCLEVLPTLPRVDAVVTDPPYGIGFAAQPTKWQRRDGQLPEAWDDSAPDIGWLVDLAPVVCVWGGNYFALPTSRGWLAWIKPDAPPSMGTVELAWTSRDANAAHLSVSISETNPERVGHPTQKPLRLMRWCIRKLKLATGSTILDPFCGSGSTGVAALQEGMNFIGIEKEAKYVEIAHRRIGAEAAQGKLGFA